MVSPCRDLRHASTDCQNAARRRRYANAARRYATIFHVTIFTHETWIFGIKMIWGHSAADGLHGHHKKIDKLLILEDVGNVPKHPKISKKIVTFFFADLDVSPNFNFWVTWRRAAWRRRRPGVTPRRTDAAWQGLTMPVWVCQMGSGMGVGTGPVWVGYGMGSAGRGRVWGAN